MATTIQIDESLLDELRSIKSHERQTYNELLRNMIKIFKKAQKCNTYDRFLHEIQKPKMKELWDNPHDEAWEDA